MPVRRSAGRLPTLPGVRSTALFTRRTRQRLLFCLSGVILGFGVPGTLLGALVIAGVIADRTQHPVAIVFLLAVVVAVVVCLVLAPRLARRLGTIHRYLAARLLDEQIPVPPRPRRLLRDGPGWRAALYQLLKLPVAALEAYPVFCWTMGLANLAYPFWWPLFRNHPPGVRLDPVPVLTPFGVFRVDTFPGALTAAAAGAAMLFVAPWLARAVTALDTWLMRGLLGPGRLAQRVADLEATRARAVDDSAAQLRRFERDLHDGTQIRLATLALNLGMAKEKLGGDGDALDLAQARELVGLAHQVSKDALAELRDLARGIHPPVLDNGLADALATLGSSSAVPVELVTDIADRPTPAIETIAYFCAAELLANAVKHSYANRITVHAVQRAGTLTVRVADDGTGGAAPAPGGGLAGLAQRISTVDGRLDIASPPGGPTRITVELPLRA
jgi:signal transduction histidine kinase